MYSIHNTYAIILNGEIVNMIVADNFHVANDCARVVSNDAQAVECSLYKCSIGDYYKDGRFYFKDGVTEIPRESTPEESIATLKQTDSELMESQVDLLYELSCLQLGIN